MTESFAHVNDRQAWTALERGAARPEVMPGRAESRHAMGDPIRR
jgi:hypothetical protein